jgi:hypothetical protein
MKTTTVLDGVTKQFKENPYATKVQKIAYLILCAQQVFHNAKWNTWANKYLSGEDRSIESARIATTIADNAPAEEWLQWAKAKSALTASLALTKNNKALKKEIDLVTEYVIYVMEQTKKSINFNILVTDAFRIV